MNTVMVRLAQPPPDLPHSTDPAVSVLGFLPGYNQVKLS